MRRTPPPRTESTDPAVRERNDAPYRETGQRRRDLLVVLAVVIWLRFFVLIVLHVNSLAAGQEGFNAIPFGGLDDGRYYYKTASMLADGERPAYVLNAFPRALALLMKIGIRDVLALKLVSFVVSSLGVVCGLGLVAEWCDERGLTRPQRLRALVLGGFLAMLLPSAVFWSSNSLMRDGWILGLTLVALWGFAGTVSEGRFRLHRLVIGLAAVIAVAPLRWYTAPILVASLLWTLVAPRERQVSWRGSPVRATVLVVSLSVGFIVGVAATAPWLSAVTGFDVMMWRSQPELVGNSSLHLSFVGAPLPLLVGRYLLSALSNAVGPLPFQISSPIHLVPALVEWPYLAAVVVLLVRHYPGDRVSRLLVTFGVSWLLVLGLWNDSLGNATRNRLIGWVPLGLAAAMAWASSDSRATSTRRWRITPDDTSED